MKRIGCGLIFLSMFILLFTGCATFKPVDLNPRISSGQLVQKTNNFVVLFDKSASMNDQHGKTAVCGQSNPPDLCEKIQQKT